MRRTHLALTLSYPLAVHFTIVAERPDWALLVLALLSLSHLLVLRLSPGHSTPATAMALFILALSLFGLWRDTVFALYLPPLLISSSLLWLFARTLRRGEEPLITRLARQVFDERNPEVLRYTRRVTQFWSLFFLAMLLESLLLALFAPLELWSLFTNLLNYLFIAALFSLEFAYRRLRFRQRTSLATFYEKITAANWGSVLQGKQS